MVHVRQLLHPGLLLRQARVLRAVSGVQQRRVGTQRQTQAGSERRLQVLRCDSVAGLPVPHQDRDGYPAGREQLQRLQAVLSTGPFHLIAVVLEPDLHLVRGEANQPRQVLSFRRGQVALLPEAALQLERLRLGEEDTPLPAAAPLRRAGLWVPLRIRGVIGGQLGGFGLGAGLQGKTVYYRDTGQGIRRTYSRKLFSNT